MKWKSLEWSRNGEALKRSVTRRQGSEKIRDGKVKKRLGRQRGEVIDTLEILCGFFGGVAVTVVTIVVAALRWDSKKKK